VTPQEKMNIVFTRPPHERIRYQFMGRSTCDTTGENEHCVYATSSRTAVRLQCISIHASLSLRHQIRDRWLDKGHIWKWTNLYLVDLGTKMQTKFGGFIHSCLPWCNLWALIYLTSPTFDCDNISINGWFLASLHEKTVKKWHHPRKTHAEAIWQDFLE
jgi:hypothetical protein